MKIRTRAWCGEALRPETNFFPGVVAFILWMRSPSRVPGNRIWRVITLIVKEVVWRTP